MFLKKTIILILNLEDSARKIRVVYEYWGNYDIDGDGITEAIVCVWIGNTVIRLEENPYPDKKPPFIVVSANNKPFELYGESTAELIGNNQKIKTAIYRNMIDLLSQSSSGQRGISKGELDSINFKRFERREDFEYNSNSTTPKIWEGRFNGIDSSVFSMINIMDNELESLTGVKSFSGGINAGSLGSTATGARGALDATAVRRMHIVRNIAETFIKPLMRKWMSYNAEFLEEEEVIRVTNKEFVPIRRDDLEGKIDIDIAIATSEDNAVKSQELSFLLQTLGPNEDPVLRREIMATIMELMRMPDKAEQMRQYQPQPDPMEQQLKELELQKLILENEKIKADIADKNARAAENSIDADLKQSKADAEKAKARKLQSEAAKKDFELFKEDEGIDHQQRIEIEKLKHQNNLLQEELKRRINIEQMALQKEMGDKQIGIIR